jgi:agmatinase/guanidinopropionase
MEFKPMSGREFPRFSAIKTFFRLPHVGLQEKFDVAIFGIPFDGGVSYRPGCRFAPTAVRNASSLGRGFHWNRGLAVFEKLKVADIGDCSVVPISIEQTYKNIEKFVGEVLKSKKKFIAVGGDHSTTLPVLRALKRHYKKPLGFVHFDAHLDTYPAAWGEEYHHGAFARHAVEEGLVDPKKMIQIGVRGPLASGEDLDFIKKHKIRQITIEDVNEKPWEKIAKELKLDDTPTYLSFDIDCMDPAFAPGTGTPVPGGLTSYQAQKILRNLKIPNLVGGDLVEIAPDYDLSGITSLMGVEVMFELLSMMAEAQSN